MLGFLIGLVVWIVVPGTLLALLIFSAVLCFDNDGNVRAIAGALAGLVVCAVYAVSSVPGSAGTPDFSTKSLMTLNVVALLVGLPIGILAGLVAAGLLEGLPEGLATLILTVSGSAGLYSYFFSARLHAYILYAALGLAFGFLVRLALSQQ
jgi:hypothetical protein